MWVWDWQHATDDAAAVLAEQAVAELVADDAAGLAATGDISVREWQFETLPPVSHRMWGSVGA